MRYDWLIAGCLMVFQACQHDPVNTGNGNDNGGNPPPLSTSCDADTAYFQNDVLPLLVSNCTASNCHDASSPKEGVNLTNYSSILSTGGVRAGSHSQSKLYNVLVDGGEDRMPPTAALTSTQISLISKWIDQGAKNNRCIGECDTVSVAFATHVLPVIQNNCAGCHSASSASGGVTLTGYTNILAATNSGQLLGTIKHLSGYVAMPPSGALTTCQIRTLEIWIANGKQNN